MEVLSILFSFTSILVPENDFQLANIDRSILIILKVSCQNFYTLFDKIEELKTGSSRIGFLFSLKIISTKLSGHYDKIQTE